MGFLDTFFGEYVKTSSRLKTKDVLKGAFTEITLAQMSDLNTQEQLREGKDADGVFLPEYSPVSVNVYGKPPGPIKLFDTGEFYDSIDFNYNGKLIVEYIDWWNLARLYGEEIVGLTNKSRNEIIPEIIENIQDQILPKL